MIEEIENLKDKEIIALRVLDDKNRVTIPKNIVKKYGINAVFIGVRDYKVILQIVK